MSARNVLRIILVVLEDRAGSETPVRLDEVNLLVDLASGEVRRLGGEVQASESNSEVGDIAARRLLQVSLEALILRAAVRKHVS